MRLQKISVKKLFGVFDHEVAFAKGENVAIIHGPNGFGKTVMLRMTAALVNGDTKIFEAIPFLEFWLDFDDGSKRGAVRRADGNQESSKPDLTLFSVDPDGASRELDRPIPPPRELIDVVDRLIPLARIGDGWRDQIGSSLSLEDVLC